MPFHILRNAPPPEVNERSVRLLKDVGMFFRALLLFPLSFHPRTVLRNRTPGSLNAGPKTSVLPSRAALSLGPRGRLTGSGVSSAPCCCAAHVLTLEVEVLLLADLSPALVFGSCLPLGTPSCFEAEQPQGPHFTGFPAEALPHLRMNHFYPFCLAPDGPHSCDTFRPDWRPTAKLLNTRPGCETLDCSVSVSLSLHGLENDDAN